MKLLLKQGFGFIAISGIGWLIDFTIYTILCQALGWPVGISNFISAIPSITFVFITSTKKVFLKNKSRLSVWQKYLVYFGYQLVLLLIVSSVSQYLHSILLVSAFSTIPVLSDYSRIVIKIFITPFTMITNFVVMKLLIEKI